MVDAPREILGIGRPGASDGTGRRHRMHPECALTSPAVAMEKRGIVAERRARDWCRRASPPTCAHTQTAQPGEEEIVARHLKETFTFGVTGSAPGVCQVS